MIFRWISVLFWLQLVESRWVRDVDSSIIDEIQNNPSNSYLIQFHAPWCGHCKHLEPIYEDFAKDVQEVENLQVVRLDATVHTDVANHYDIRGFPTIKFIHQSTIITYEGQRTKDALLKFVQRAHGPKIQHITSRNVFEQLRKETPVFIVFIIDLHNSTLPDQYQSVVDRYYTRIEFYTTDDRTLFSNDESSEVFVIKNQHSFPYEPSDYDDKLEAFVQAENMQSFPQISHSNIRDLIQTKKILVIYAYDDRKFDEERKEWKERVQQYVDENLSKFRKKFQFGWSIDLELLSHIAVWTVDEPLFFLYDSQKHSYGITSVDVNIDDILADSSEIIRHKGDSLSKRLLRPFWELYQTMMSMFIEAPLASMLVIGLPISILSILCYCICCLPNESAMPDFRDDPNDEDNDSNEIEQKSSTLKKDE